MKCNIPSFVSDHVEIIEWLDSNGGQYFREQRVTDAKSGSFKAFRCVRHVRAFIPRHESFRPNVARLVDRGFFESIFCHNIEISPSIQCHMLTSTFNPNHRTVVSQFYESQVSDEYVIKGNAAVLKCNIPSFVSDHVFVLAWLDTNGLEYIHGDSSGTRFDLHSTNHKHESTMNVMLPSCPSKTSESSDGSFCYQTDSMIV